MSDIVESIEALEALYGQPAAASVKKVVHRVTPLYRQWIEASRYCVLSSVGPDGTDGSPRGDDGPVATVLDQHTLAMPDWRGNNRLDTLRNIVLDGRISVMFMVPGSDLVVRVNGQARLSTAQPLRRMFEAKDKHPATVILIRVGEIYAQCARASMRAGIWGRDDSANLPTMGQLLAEATNGEEGGDAYDAVWPERAQRSLW